MLERFAATLVKCSPPSMLSWRLPSSVPTQITPGRAGDSAIIVMSELVEMPSFFSSIGAVPGTPRMEKSGPKRFNCFVRSVGFTHQLSPRSVDLKKYCAPAYNSAGLCGDITNGELELKRRFLFVIVAGASITLAIPPLPPPPGATGLTRFAVPLRKSMRSTTPHCDPPYTVAQSVGSCRV